MDQISKIKVGSTTYLVAPLMTTTAAYGSGTSSSPYVLYPNVYYDFGNANTTFATTTYVSLYNNSQNFTGEALKEYMFSFKTAGNATLAITPSITWSDQNSGLTDSGTYQVSIVNFIAVCAKV